MRADCGKGMRLMGRSASYLGGIGVAALALLVVSWAVRSEAPAATGGVRQDGAFAFKSLPTGAEGPLKPCVVCHSVEEGGPMRVAPSLHGIVGAPKARARWYAYSPALARAGGNWTEAELDRFLAGPSAAIPGTNKTIVGYADARTRADIIAALKAAR